MESKQLSRKERRRLQDRELIMKTASRLFADNGYHNVSMNEIASVAEFAVGTLYKFFNTKEELYKSIFLDLVRKSIMNSMEILSGDGEVLKMLRLHLVSISEFMVENQDLVRLYFLEIHGLAQNIKVCEDEEFMEIKHKAMDRITEIFARGIKEGIFRKLNPRSMQLAYTGMYESLMLAWLDDPQSFSAGIDVDFILDVTMHGMKST